MVLTFFLGLLVWLAKPFSFVPVVRHLLTKVGCGGAVDYNSLAKKIRLPMGPARIPGDNPHPFPFNPNPEDRFRCNRPGCGFTYPAQVICPKCDGFVDVPLTDEEIPKGKEYRGLLASARDYKFDRRALFGKFAAVMASAFVAAHYADSIELTQITTRIHTPVFTDGGVMWPSMEGLVFLDGNERIIPLKEQSCETLSATSVLELPCQLHRDILSRLYSGMARRRRDGFVVEIRG